MPRQEPAIETRIHKLAACLTPAVMLLEELNTALGPLFIQPIVKTVQALIAGVQSETAGSLPPPVLDKIAEFTDTLHKIYTFLEIQQDGNKIRQFFRQSEVNKLLKDCHTGLNQANETFKVQTGFTMLNNVIQVQYEAEAMHTELLELITTLFDDAEARSIYEMNLQDNELDPSSSLYGSVLLNLSLINVLIGATTDTVNLTLDRAQEIFSDMKWDWAMMYYGIIVADLNSTKGNEASAKNQFRITSKKLAFYKALLFIGDLFIDVDEVTAENLFIVALEGFTFMDVHRSRAQCMLLLGDLAQKKAEITKAVELWTVARPLFERSLQAKDVAVIDMRLVALGQGHRKSLTQLAVPHAPSTGVNKNEETTAVRWSPPRQMKL
ncbi:hypothetical protein B0H16DRAFT_1786551 [Mycena metata]|uniref:Uncharacterized protein n=1 Tax=Mycena metata TaxID=1033252 RepID=A0AAD7HML5_9AGAR|nr:hypothetical protein B0H16DRAFT_1786551 [Mycena metata]